MDTQFLIRCGDVEIARSHPEVLVFGDLLRRSSEPYNLLKLRVFSSCHHFITVQGGNAHLCALFPGSLVTIQHTAGAEGDWAYTNGTFQFLSNPRPTYLIGRQGAAMREITGAFKDCIEIDDSIHLGPTGLALYRRYNPAAWRSAPVQDNVAPTPDAKRIEIPIPPPSVMSQLLRRFRTRLKP